MIYQVVLADGADNLTVYKGISNPVDSSKECMLLLEEGKMVLKSLNSMTMMKKAR